MRNVGTLYLAEIKKILSKKFVWVVLAIGLVLIMTINGSNALFDDYDYPDGTRVSGMEYYKQEAQECSKLNGRPVDDDFINDVRNSVIDCAIEKGYLTQADVDDVIANDVKGFIIEYADGSFSNADSPVVALNQAAEEMGLGNAWYFLQNVVGGGRSILTCDAAEFYKVWNDELSYTETQNGGDFADSFSSYWEEKAASIDTPFTYSYNHSMNVFIEGGWFYVWFVFLLIALSLAGVFADDRITKTDALILSSRNGRMPIATAKILAGFTVGVVETLIIYAVSFAGTVFLFGGSGWNAPIQQFITECCWNATEGQVIITYLVLTLCMSILFAAVTMFLSGVLGGTQTLGIQMAVLMIGFFNLPSNGFLAKLWDLRPTTFLTNGALENNNLFSLGTLQLNCVEMATVIYVLFAVAFTLGVLIVYKRYQIKSR